MKRRSSLIGGEAEGWLAGRLFHEPGGLSYADGKLYVADTNAHRIRVVDLKRKAVSTRRSPTIAALWIWAAVIRTFSSS